jgi:hypothetical protein
MSTDHASTQLQKIIDELADACWVKPFRIKDIPSLISRSGGLYQLAVYKYARLILDGKSAKKESIEELKRKIMEREKGLYGSVDTQRSRRYYDNILTEFRYNYRLLNGNFDKALIQTTEMMDCSEEDVHTAIEVEGRGLLQSYAES